MAYNFLTLSLIFLIPGLIVYISRKDLRKVIHLMALFSLPFALTERFFYPSYWEPVFLFNLIDIIGFGIEDILFVIGLSAFTSTAYAFFMRRRYTAAETKKRVNAAVTCCIITGIVLIMVTTSVMLEIEMIYGSFLIMGAISLFIFIRRRDLCIPGLAGGFFSAGIYTGLCLLLSVISPGIFQLTWHTDQFLNSFILGIPVEELIYGFASGTIATIFYPFVFDLEFKKPYRPVTDP